MRLTKTLLAAAVAIGATVTTAKAYDLYNSGWDYSQPNFSYGSYFVGDGWAGREYRTLTNARVTPYIFGLISNANETDLVNAGVYRGISGSFTWSGNEYNDFGDPGSAAYVYGELESGAADGEGGFVDGLGDFDQQNGYYTNGTYYFDSRDSTTNIAIGNNAYGVYMDTDGNYFGAYVSGGATVYERDVQVARTGSGFNGAYALSAFASDNSETLSGSFYNADIVGRNVLRTAAAFYDGEGGYGPSLTGSVVRQADIALGFSGSEGLYAKDGGWLDIRGDLTLGASGTIYIRDGEITANVYTQFYTPGTLDTVGRLAIESGILSVRERFAQDMVASWNQTLGFRDGAVNESRLILEGAGYGFDGEGAFGPEGSSAGALRSITGDNVQNGNISVVADGEGFFPGAGNGALIGTDLGSTLTINGSINGLNSGASEGGAFLGYFSEGDTVQNGRILSGIVSVLKAGRGELLLTASNLFTGELRIQEGSARATNAGAFSGHGSMVTTDSTFVESGASLVLDHATGMSLTETFNITGAGTASIGAALHNKSGANTTTGQVFLENGDATILVNASSSLTVGSLSADDSAFDLTLGVLGSGATAGAFTVSGNTGNVGYIIKNGTGNATLTSLSSALADIDVNAGNLLVLGGESAVDDIFGALDIDGTLGVDGKPLGTLEIRGTHHYDEFNVSAVDTLIKGTVTHHGTVGNDIDITLGATVTVDAGASLVSEYLDDSADIEDDAKLVVKGTFQANNGSYIDLDDEAVLDIRAGGIVNSRIVTNNDSSVVIAGADGEGLGAGVLTGDVLAYNYATVTVNGTLNGFVEAYDNATINLNGTLNGDVETYENATLTLGANAVHNGDYTAYGSAVITVNGSIDNNEGNPLGQNFSLSGSARLQGSGTIGGNLTQTGGIVAPGNSTDVLTVLGNYSINAGSLQVELGGTDGPGNDPTGNDQLAVGGTVTVGGTAVLDFEPYNQDPITLNYFEPVRGDVFQVIATAAGAARATIGTFDTVQNGQDGRVLFDHSTGRAYGTGLSLAGLRTFADYGNTGNRADIGRALWMESIAKDNSGFDDNYGTGAIDPTEALANSGLKAFILTRDTGLLDATQVRTDLGAAAVSVLTAADVGAALDALSPEAYVGITELGVRVTRGFAQLPGAKRKLAVANEWDFSVGYANEQITADSGSSTLTNYKVSSDQVHLTAARDLSKNLRLTLAAGIDDGEVGASGFTADTDTQAFAVGLGYTPDSKGWTADLGLALTRTDWDASRGVAQNSADNEDGLGVALRVSLAPTVDGALSYAPYIGLSYATQDQSAVSEVGADNDGQVGLGFAGYERKSLVSELGLKAEYALNPGTTLTGVVAWEHELEDDGATTLDAEFTEDGVTDTRFAVTSAGFGADIFRVGVGVRVELGAKSAFSLGYDALLSSDAKSGQGIKADVSFRF